MAAPGWMRIPAAMRSIAPLGDAEHRPPRAMPSIIHPRRCQASSGSAPSPWEGTETPQVFASALASAFGLGGFHRRPADNLSHLAGLLRQRPHLRLHIFAVQPHDFGQILGAEQRLRIVQRCLHVPFGIGNRLGADVLGAGTDRLASLLDRACGLLRAGEEFFKGLARLIEAGFRHRSHFFWNFETLSRFFAHGPTPVAYRRAIHGPDAPFAHVISTKDFAGMTRRPSVPSWTFDRRLQHPNAGAAARFGRIKVISALASSMTARPWTCRRPRAILTV